MSSDTLIQAVPVLATLAWFRGFTNRFSGEIERFSLSKHSFNALNFLNPVFTVIASLLSCPLCLCFHAAWIWSLVTDYNHFVSTYTIGYVFGSSVLAYTLHHLIEVVVKTANTLELVEAEHLNRLPKAVAEGDSETED
jgi:hypothetical protein